VTKSTFRLGQWGADSPSCVYHSAFSFSCAASSCLLCLLSYCFSVCLSHQAGSLSLQENSFAQCCLVIKYGAYAGFSASSVKCGFCFSVLLLTIWGCYITHNCSSRVFIIIDKQGIPNRINRMIFFFFIIFPVGMKKY